MLPAPSVRSIEIRNGWVMPGLAGGAEEERPQRPAEGGQHADRHQRVHRRRAVAQVGPRGAVEGPRAPHHDRRGEGERGPLPVGELPGRHHRHRDDRDAERGADQQPLEQRVALGLVGGGLGVGRRRQRGGVARGLDGAEQVVGGDGAGVGDLGLLGGVVDRRGHAVELVELALDAVGARRAGHAGDGELDVVRVPGVVVSGHGRRLPRPCVGLVGCRVRRRTRR